MSVLKGSCEAEIGFSIERCWALVADVERAPEWQRTLLAVTVIERDGEGRALVCDTENDAKLRRVHCRVRFAYDPPRRLRFEFVSSDDLGAMDGAWTLESLGSERTRATYSLAIDPGPIGLLARPLERAIRPIVIGHQAQELARGLAAQTPGA